MTALVFVLVSFVLSAGCAHKPSYDIAVFSLADPAFDTNKVSSYVAMPGDKTVSKSDLMFKEVVRTITPSFAANNMRIVDSPDSANYVVLIRYGIGQPQEHYGSYQVEDYGVVGYYGRWHHSRPIYGVTRTTTIPYTYTTYSKGLSLEAFKLVDKAGKRIPGDQVWKTELKNTGTSDDLLQVIRAMVQPLTMNIAKNTAQTLTYSVEEEVSKEGMVTYSMGQ